MIDWKTLSDAIKEGTVKAVVVLWDVSRNRAILRLDEVDPEGYPEAGLQFMVELDKDPSKP